MTREQRMKAAMKRRGPVSNRQFNQLSKAYSSDSNSDQGKKVRARGQTEYIPGQTRKIGQTKSLLPIHAGKKNPYRIDKSKGWGAGNVIDPNNPKDAARVQKFVNRTAPVANPSMGTSLTPGGQKTTPGSTVRQEAMKKRLMSKQGRYSINPPSRS